MGKGKKKGKNESLENIVLANSILNLLKAVIELIKTVSE